MEIENKNQPQGEEGQESGSGYSMRDLKKKLVKQDLGSLEDLKYEIYCVVDSYRIGNFIDDEIYKEYINFVNLLISEADSILKEKLESEKKGTKEKMESAPVEGNADEEEFLPEIN